MSFNIQKDNKTIFRHPVPFEVIDVTHNAVTVKRWSQNLIIGENYFSEKVFDQDSILLQFDPIIDLPDCSAPWYILTNKINKEGAVKDVYLVCDIDGKITGDSEGFPMNPANPADWNANIATNPASPFANKYIASHQYVGYQLSIMDFVTAMKIPHVGEKIACKSWVLKAYVTGERHIIRGLNFIRANKEQEVCPFFMKAHWGFIPG